MKGSQVFEGSHFSRFLHSDRNGATWTDSIGCHLGPNFISYSHFIKGVDPMPTPRRSHFESRRAFLRFAGAMGLASFSSVRASFAIDGLPALGNQRTPGQLVTITEGEEGTLSIIALDSETAKWREVTTSAFYCRLSPDGTMVAYAIGTELWLCALKPGSKPALLGNVGNPNAADDPSRTLAWMPDGKSVIASAPLKEFESRFTTFRCEIDGGNFTALRLPETHCILDISRDRRWILTWGRRNDSEAGQLYRMRLDGTEERQLTREPAMGGATGGRLSRDGSKIIYTHADEDPKNHGLFLINADGSNRRRIHHASALACWSPEGDRLAIATDDYAAKPFAPPRRVEDAAVAPAPVDAPPKENERANLADGELDVPPHGRIEIIDLQGKKLASYPLPQGKRPYGVDWR
ncbi:TolB family protein [Singulisphaera rosea]